MNSGASMRWCFQAQLSAPRSAARSRSIVCPPTPEDALDERKRAWRAGVISATVGPRTWRREAPPALHGPCHRLAATGSVHALLCLADLAAARRERR